MAALFFAIPFLDPTASIGMTALCIGMGLLFGVGFLAVVWERRVGTEIVAVDAAGIWGLTPGRPRRFLAWNNISVVRARDGLGCLYLYDTSGAAAMRVEYQTERFEHLRSLILERSEKGRSGARPTVFWRSWGAWLELAFMVGLLLWAIGWTVLESETGLLALVLVAGVPMVLHEYGGQPFKIRIGPEGVAVCRLFMRKLQLAYPAIADVGLATLRTHNGHHLTTAQIHLRNGKPVILNRFAAGVICLYDSLRAGWLDGVGASVEKKVGATSGRACDGLDW